MKILIKRDGKKVEVYHDPNEILSNPKTRMMTILDGSTKKKLAEHCVISKMLGWVSTEAEEEEILVEFEVQ